MKSLSLFFFVVFFFFGRGVLSSNAFTILCCIPISRPPRVFRRFKRRSCIICVTWIALTYKDNLIIVISHFTCFFCSNCRSQRPLDLSGCNIDGVQRWTIKKQLHLPSKTTIFIPICNMYVFKMLPIILILFIHPFEKRTYYAVAMSVRPSEFSGLFSTCFEITIWNLVYAFRRWHDMSSLSFITIGSFWPSLQPK